MKVSEPWLNALIELSIPTEDLASQLTNAGIEVDSIERFSVSPDGESSEKASSQNEAPHKTSTSTNSAFRGKVSSDNRSSNNKSTYDKSSEDDQTSEYAVLTLKIPANRGDCLGMEGVAREVAVLNVLSFPGIKIAPYVPNIPDTFPIHIDADAKDACPRYVARIIQNVNPNAETPAWMLNRLVDAGLRSVSVIVDIGNYVMLELGQPLHAFDLSKVENEIQIRFAKPKETIITLDSKNMQLDAQTLVIADKQKPLAIAGIMGGLESAVNNTTRKILLESAFFEPNQLRSAAKRLNMRTESSLRFERGVDPDLQVRALERATQLLLEIVGGNAGPMIEQVDTRRLPEAQKILLRLSKVKDILGICPHDEIQDILIRLGMKVNPTAIGFEVLPPSYRADILREVDLIEEIARIYGYDRIPKSNPIAAFEFTPIPEAKLDINRLKQMLVDKGYDEAITYSFLSAEWLNFILPSEQALTLANPISEELAVMRPSLWPGLLKAVQNNQRRSQLRLKMFETGLCFIQKKDGTGVSTQDGALAQNNHIAGIAVGTVASEQWGIKSQDLDFYDIKNDVEALLSLTARKDIRFEAAEHEALHPRQAAKIMLGNEKLGMMGALHPRLLKQLDLQGPLFLFEMDLSLLTQRIIPTFQELSKFPIIRRDIAIIVDKTVLAEELKSVILECAGSLARDVLVFDVYQGKGIEPGRKSVAIGLTLQHPSRTLVESEVNDLMQKVLQALADRFKAILRE